jgi:hypothetical protein
VLLAPPLLANARRPIAPSIAWDHFMGIKRDPLAVADIKARRERGETLDSIGKSYGVTREYIRQVCIAFNIEDKSPSIYELTKKAINLLKTGKASSVPQAAKSLGVKSPIRLWKAADYYELDLSSALKYAIAHKHDGNQFDMWKVLPGSYRRVMKEGNRKPTALVDCHCDCGTERTVSWHNLKHGVTRGCGCRSKTGATTTRMNVPWRCLETEERHPTTTALANRFGVKSVNLTGNLNLQKKWIAPDKTTWIPLHQQASAYIPGLRGQPWTCLDTGETWTSAKELSNYLGVSTTGMYNCARQERTYCAANKRHYVPVAMKNFRRSKFYTRRGNQITRDTNKERKN